MSELREQARGIMRTWNREDLISEAVSADLITEVAAKSLNNEQLVVCLERDMSDPEIVDFLESNAEKAK